jgi:basic amino acid/polyamine antiporter, APA family
VSDGANPGAGPLTGGSREFLRILGRRDLLTLAFGAIIGWSWVMIAGRWVAEAGPLGAMLAFAIGGVVVLLVGLTYAELAAALPYAGGEHVYSMRALGFAGSFVCTWALILGYASVVTFEAIALPTALEYLFPQLRQGLLWRFAGSDVHASFVAIGAVAAMLVTVVNLAGVKPAARLQTIVLAFMVIVGAGFLLFALVAGDPARLSPPFGSRWQGLLVVLVMTPTLYVGFDVIPQAAEETRIAHRQIGVVLLAAVLMAIAWYMLIILGVALGLEPARLMAPLSTAEAAAAVTGTRLGATLLVLAGIGGIVTSWNAFVVGASRAIYAMAESSMLPSVFARLGVRSRVPTAAIVLLGTLAALAPLAGRSMLVWLIDAGSFAIVLAYGLVAASFLVLGRKEPQLERPYRVRRPRLVGTLAVLASLGMLVLYLPGSPAALAWPWEWSIVLGWSAAGVVLLAIARLGRRQEAAAVRRVTHP